MTTTQIYTASGLGCSCQDKKHLNAVTPMPSLPVQPITPYPTEPTVPLYKIGTVVDENVKPIADLHVINKTQNIATKTNAVGVYNIITTPNDVLVFSHVSFGEIEMQAKNVPDVLKINQSNMLDEVVINPKKKTKEAVDKTTGTIIINPINVNGNANPPQEKKNKKSKVLKYVGIGLLTFGVVAGGLYYIKNKPIEVQA